LVSEGVDPDRLPNTRRSLEVKSVVAEVPLRARPPKNVFVWPP
jgi:hypothetical protein